MERHESEKKRRWSTGPRSWWVGLLALSSAACTPGTPAGASRGVAARSPHVDLPARFPTSHEPHGSPRVDEPTQAVASNVPNVTQTLPFRVHVAPSDAIVPAMQRFPARLSRSCVTASTAKPGGLRAYTLSVEGTFVVSSYTLRARLDDHTSRPLVLGKKGRTEIALETLSNEWSAITPGVHEVVVFARDKHGVVPHGPDGALAFDRCRFEIAADGSVAAPSRQDASSVMFSPEGTLHGAASDPAWLQVAVASETELPQLRIERPDGGEEVHELRSERLATCRHGLFEVGGLQNGDYTFSLVLPVRGERVSPEPARVHAHRISVNRERAGTE